MKGFKKGIALIAVLAFLITAVVPAAAFASADPGAAPETPGSVIVGNSAKVEINRTSNMPTDASYYRLETSPNTPDAPNLDGKFTFSVEGDKVIIDIEAGALDKVGSWQYRLYFIQAATGFPMTLGNITINVVEAKENYKITLDPAEPENGTVEIDPAEALTDGVAAGETITVTAAPVDESYGLKSITAVPEIADLDINGNQATFTMPAADVTLTVEFAKAYTIDTESAPKWLLVASSTATAGTVVTVRADPEQIDDGTGIADLKVTDADGKTVPLTYVSPTEYTFVMPESDVSITAAENTVPVPEEPEDGYPVTVPDGVSADPASAKPGDTVTITVEPDADGNYPAITVTANGTELALTPAVDDQGNVIPGKFTFRAPAGDVVITTGSEPPAPPAPVYPQPTVITGDAYIQDCVDTNGAPTMSDPFTYWTQPNAGLFNDGEAAGTVSRPTVGVPVELPQPPSGSMKAHFQVGPANAAVCGGGTENLVLNDRLQIYYNPNNIFVVPDYDETGALLGYKPLNNCNWSDYVTMEWEYKPSTKDEDDGNPLKIPAGFGFSGVRSPMLTISPLTEYMDGWWVRLAIYPKTDAPNASDLYITTRWIRLDIAGVNGALDPDVTITSNPEAVGSTTNVSRGGDAVFTANVANQPYGSTLSYQWQSLAQPTAANPTPQWAPISGATSQSLTLSNVTDAMSGTSYRCEVTCTESGPSNLGSVNVSNSLSLNVTEPDGSVYVTACNPSGSRLIYKFVGDTLQAQISAKTDNGDPMKYQWYVRSYLAPVPSSIDTVAEAAAYLAGAASEEVPGATGASMTSEPLREGVYGFRCRVENANDPAKSVYGPIIYVIVSEDQIEIYPAPGDIISAGVVNGHSLTLEARAKAQNVSYQWQRYNTASQQWTTLTATGKKLTLPMLTTEATGTLYRCAISAPGSTNPVYTGWYLINVWDTANTPVVTKTAQNLRCPLSKFANDLQVSIDANTDANGVVSGTMDLFSSSATVAQDLTHGIGPVWAVWYNKDGKAVSASSYGTSSAALRPIMNWAQNASLYSSGITSPTKGSYTSMLKLNLAGVINGQGECASPATIARAINGTYYCVWYKPQTVQEALEQTMYTYLYPGNQNRVPVDMTKDMWLLAPQAVRGRTDIRIEIEGDPWIITDLPDTATAAVGQKATMAVAAAITQPSDTTTPVYTWQVTEDGGSNWRNCLSSDGTGQFTPTFTTRTITQSDYDTNTTLSYRVIVASRPNVAKIVSNTCALSITEGTPGAPVITPGPDSPIRVENGIATGCTVSKEGTTVSAFLEALNMSVPAGYSLRIAGSDGQPLASDAIVYTGCVLQLVDDSTGEVAAQATIIIAGDVLGTGILGINQVVRMAQDLNGSRPLGGIYEQAGDFNGSGAIDIADLVREAQLLQEPIEVQK